MNTNTQTEPHTGQLEDASPDASRDPAPGAADPVAVEHTADAAPAESAEAPPTESAEPEANTEPAAAEPVEDSASLVEAPQAPDDTALAQAAEDAEGPNASDGSAAPEEAQPAASEPIPELGDEDREALARVVFSLLFASPDPLSLGRLKDLTESPAVHVRQALDALGLQLESSGLPLVLKEIAGGYRLFSAPEVAAIVQRLAKVRKAEKVTPAALETLSIVAYRQPTTKAEVEAIRGVQAGPMLRSLIDRGLVKVAGRADQPGSPLLYATTREFLDRFGLGSLKELPRDNELAR